MLIPNYCPFFGFTHFTILPLVEAAGEKTPFHLRLLGRGRNRPNIVRRHGRDKRAKRNGK
jgi:hypothetical protein